MGISASTTEGTRAATGFPPPSPPPGFEPSCIIFASTSLQPNRRPLRMIHTERSHAEFAFHQAVEQVGVAHVQLLAKSSEWLREKDRLKNSGFIFEGKKLHFFPLLGHDFLSGDRPSLHADFSPDVFGHAKCRNGWPPKPAPIRPGKFQGMDREGKSHGLGFMGRLGSWGKVWKAGNLYGRRTEK